MKTPKYVSKYFPLTTLPWRYINCRKKNGHIINFGSSDFCFLQWAREGLSRSWSWRAYKLHWKQMMVEAERSRWCVSSLWLRNKCSLIEERPLQPWPRSATQKLCRWLQDSSFKSHQEGVPSRGQVLSCKDGYILKLLFNILVPEKQLILWQFIKSIIPQKSI